MLTIDGIEILTNGRLELTFIPCPQCHMPHKLVVRQDEFEDWISGMDLDKAFPYMFEPQRELFTTGIDGECWLEIFKQGEDEGAIRKAL